MDPNELETVFTTNDPSQAHIIQGALQAEGIACEVAGDHQGGFTGILAVRLLVRAWDADRARAIIKSHGHGHAP
jgi:hypothetical protein